MTSKLIHFKNCRFYILYGLYRYVRFSDEDSIKYLLKAKYVAQKQGNLLDLQWSEHTEKVNIGVNISSILILHIIY
jgi:hypothetical protein